MANLIICGDFSCDSANWALGTGWTRNTSLEQLEADSSAQWNSTSYNEFEGISVGQTLYYSFDIITLDVDDGSNWDYFRVGETDIPLPTSTGNFTGQVSSSSTSVFINWRFGGVITSIVIDNVIVSDTPITDTIPPNLSSPTATNITSSSVVLGATTDEDNGTAHAIIVPNGEESLPTNQEVIDASYTNQVAVASDLIISSVGAFTFQSISSLSSSTTYGYVIVHVDSVGNEDSGSRVEGTFTTAVYIPPSVDISGTNGPGLTLVTDADSTTGFSGTSGQLDTTEFYQGTGSYTYQSGKNARTSCTFTPASALDWSLTNGHFFFSMKCAVFAFSEPKATGTSINSGLTCRVRDGSGNYTEWHVAGNDTWDGSWKQFVIDLANTSEIYAQTGTLILTDIIEIEIFVDLSNSGNIRIIDNTWLDVMYFGTGVVVTGSDISLNDVYSLCSTTSNRYPIIHRVEGVNLIQGAIQFGDSGTTSTSWLSNNEIIVFRDAPVGSGLYALKTSTVNVILQSCTLQSAGTQDATRYLLDFTGASDCNVSGCAITRSGDITFTSSHSVTNCLFNDCLVITPTSSDFKDNTISGYQGSAGALLWPGSTTVTSCTFLENTYAIRVTQTIDQTFQALTFDDVSGNYDVHLDNGGIDITIAKVSGSNPNSYWATGGGTVTFSASYTLTLTNVIEGTQVTIVDSSSRNELQNSTTPASGLITYAHSGGSTIDVMFMHLDYDPNLSDIFDLELPNSNSSVKIQQIDDPNYDNPI